MVSETEEIMPFALLLTLAGCHKQVVEEAAVTPVRVTPVNLYKPQTAARYSASILPGRQVTLAFRVSGFVTDIHRKGGRGLEPGRACRHLQQIPAPRADLHECQPHHRGPKRVRRVRGTLHGTHPPPEIWEPE